MISQQELLDIICTEAIEYGGLQEVPGHKHGSKQSFHSPKRESRGPKEPNGDNGNTVELSVNYNLRLVQEIDGSLDWKD